MGTASGSGAVERLDYYRLVAPRMIPFLRDHPVVVHRVETGGLSRPVVTDPVSIETPEELLTWVERGASAFFLSPLARTHEVWFALGLTARGIPFEASRLITLKLLLVLGDLDIDRLILFNGDRGFTLLWTWGAPDPDELPGGLWNFQRTVAARLRDLMETRLAGTMERDRIGRWVGYEGPVTRIESGPALGRLPVSGGGRAVGQAPGDDCVVLDSGALAPAGLIRAPYSLHECSGLATFPLTRDDLYRFRRDEHAESGRVSRLRREYEVPLNFAREVGRQLEI